MTSSLSRKSGVTCSLPFGPILGLPGCRAHPLLDAGLTPAGMPGSSPPGMLRLTPSRDAEAHPLLDAGAHPLPGCWAHPLGLLTS